MNHLAELHELQRKAERLAFNCYLRTGHVPEELQEILSYKFAAPVLYYKSRSFDFIAAIANGSTLLVGEGNLSFSLSLAQDSRVCPYWLTATTYQNEGELTEFAKDNADRLRALGATVLHDIDATQLHRHFGSALFQNVTFQFPHTGSREPIEGRNPNHVLLRNFLMSARYTIPDSGKVLVTTVDSPYYRGAFQFDLAAELAGYHPPEPYPFMPSKFPGYVHTMTHEDGSALEDHDTFATWVFRKKK